MLGASESGPAIAIFDEDSQFASGVGALLATAGFRCLAFPRFTVSAMARQISGVKAVFLDLAGSDLGRLEAIRHIRGASDVPIVVVTADDLERDKVRALDAGADDYLTKPIMPGEFMARVRLALRHGQERSGRKAATVELGELRIDLVRREASLSGERLALTPTDYRLLALLSRNQGRVVTRERLLHDGWGPKARDPHYLRVYMARLRRKLDPAREGTRYIVTEPGVGYRLTASLSAASRR